MACKADQAKLDFSSELRVLDAVEKMCNVFDSLEIGDEELIEFARMHLDVISTEELCRGSTHLCSHKKCKSGSGVDRLFNMEEGFWVEPCSQASS